MGTKRKIKITEAPLSWPERYLQIAVMTNAGLALDHALATIQKGTAKPEVKLDRAIGLVKRGRSFANAFQTSQLLSNFDYPLINNAEQAGKLGAGLRHIAERRIEQVQRVRSLKSGLLLPKFVLLIGGFAGVFIKMNADGTSLLQALLSVVLTVIMVLAVSAIFERLLLKDSRRWMSWCWPIELIRVRSERYQLLFEAVFFRSLLWQISSGIDMQRALQNCASLLNSKKFKTQVSSTVNELASGMSLPESLESNGLILSKRMQQVVQIANESGRYEQAIQHELDLQSRKLKHDTDALFKWLPRVFYLIVIIVLSRFVLSP